MSAAERIFQFLLLCYPPEFRDEYGTEMTALFREQKQERPAAALWLRLIADVGTTASRERLDVLMKDLTYAIRTFLKNPGFALPAILVMALGIGVSSAMFSAVDAVLIRKLPFAHPEQLAMVWEPNASLKIPTDYISVSSGDFHDWATQNRSFRQLAAFLNIDVSLSDAGHAEPASATQVSGGFFSALGANALLGRPLVNDDCTPGQERVAALSYNLWKNRFHGDTAIVGKNIRLDGQNYNVVGVMAQGFRFPQGNEMPAFYGFPPVTDLWIPLVTSSVALQDRNNHRLLVLGRLRPGVSQAQAQADLETVQRRLQRTYPDNDRGFDVRVVPLQSVIVGHVRTELLLLFGAVGFVLLIACANVANLLLARATVRSREIAVRNALGAPRGRLIRQLLVESTLLSLIGAAGGLLLAFLLIHALVALAPANIPRVDQASLDWRVIAFTAGIAILTGLLFGAAPALQMSRLNFVQDLRASGSHTRKALVIAEVALAMILLVGAGLTLRSLLAVQTVNPGFETRRIVSMELVLPNPRYQEAEARKAFFRELLDRVKPLPGVESVGLVSGLPLSGDENLGSLHVKGIDTGDQTILIDQRWASEGYFEALGIHLLEGRTFQRTDSNPAIRSAVVNQAVVRRFFPNENPIGRQVRIGGGNRDWLTIVGVVADVRNSSLDAPPRLQCYAYTTEHAPQAMALAVRAVADSRQLVSSIRQAVARIDPDQAVSNVSTMDELVSGSLSMRRFSTLLLGLFAFLALTLTVVGLYGVVAYNVAQRSREIGVRIALGATQRNVMSMILREALLMGSAGIVLGTLAILASGRLLTGMLFGVSAGDPFTLGGIAGLLIAVTLLAAYIPSRGAALTDPNVVLRSE